MQDTARYPEMPNVVLICYDHLRADWFGRNGHAEAMTRAGQRAFATTGGPHICPQRDHIGLDEYGTRLRPLPETYITLPWTVHKAMEFVHRLL